MERNITIDSVDCIINAGIAKGQNEVMRAPRIKYDCMIHRNTQEYLAWLLYHGKLTVDDFMKTYSARFGGIKEFMRTVSPLPLEKWVSDNIVTLEGKDALNNIMFHAATQIAQWYVLIFNTNTTCVNTLTYATPVFTESTDYDETTRPVYSEAASSSQSITNTASRATFTMNASTTIYGCALVGGGSDPSVRSNTLGGGVLYSASKFSEAKTVVSTNVLSVGITISQS